jgi:hypothetical protein
MQLNNYSLPRKILIFDNKEDLKLKLTMYILVQEYKELTNFIKK